MPRRLRIALICVTLFFLFPGLVLADLAVIKNGDKLFGKILNPYFALQAPYGQIIIRSDFVKKVIFDENLSGQAALQSINNDIFHGRLLNEDFQLRLNDGKKETLASSNLQLIRMDTRGPSYRVITTLFSMQNGDRFAAQILDPELAVKPGYLSSPLRSKDINRIEFDPHGSGRATILLTNGDRLQGQLMARRIRIAPETFALSAVDTDRIRTIQFNAPRLLLKQLSSIAPAQRDSDADGVLNPADQCPHTPWGLAVDADGCPEAATAPAATATAKSDSDGDGIADSQDRCPHTPAGAAVNAAGCWIIDNILFAFNQYAINPRYHALLDAVSGVLLQNPTLKIQLRGYTDNTGRPDYNRLLSEKRARATATYLIRKGISAARIATRGYGAADNIAPNATVAGRALNRRVEIVVLD